MINENNNISFGNKDQKNNTQIINQNFIDNKNNNFTVTPWEVEGDIDYNKLIEKFGTFEITN